MTGYKRVSEMTLEEKREKVAGFNVMDDVFFQKMMEDKEVCEEILRIILENSKMRVIECVPQASIKNLNGKSVVLDVLCRDNDGKYCNVEVQTGNRRGEKSRPQKRYGSESEQSDWKGTGTFKCIVCE